MRRRAFLAALVAAPFAGAAIAHPAPGTLADKIARRYSIAPVAAALVVETAHDVFPEDPALLVALAGTESSMRPFAAGARGEIGLTQVRAALHGYDPAALIDPRVNLAAGARILRQCIRRAGGDVTRGLTRYNGAGRRARTYAQRVLVERRLLAA